MSRVFYDHLLELENLSSHINEICETEEERVELWHIIDEIIHHRVLGCVLDHLSIEHHEPFVERFKNEPHNEELIVFINGKIEHDIEEKIMENVKILQEELLRELIG
jgi:hypothetical protein